MHGFRVSLSGSTASFREQGAQLYQATLPLPPISTLVGIAGAAVGKRFEDAWEFFRTAGLFVGVAGASRGRGTDLWRYRKIATPKSDVEKKWKKEYGLSKIERADILNREFLAFPRFHIFYALENAEEANRLRKAFFDPVYALSLGTSDDIAMIEEISALSVVKEGIESDSFQNILLEGDFSDRIRFDWDVLKRSGVAHVLKAPIVRPLVVDFSFKGSGQRMERRGSRYRLFTFLSGIQRLTEPQRAYGFEGEESVVSLYGIKGTGER